MAFLRMKTSHGHTMGDVYSCFQKYVRRGDYESALYWGAQIGRKEGEYKGYPNALKKRLMQHALEDAGNIEYAIQLLNKKIADWEDLIGWIKVLCEMPKTRGASWFNRIAVEYINDPVSAPTEILRKSATALQLHRDDNVKQLALLYSKNAMKLYKEINKEVLVFHVLHLKEAGIIPVHPDCKVSAEEKIGEDLDTVRGVPDWAYDKHTSIGKKMGRGYEHFFETMIVHPKLVKDRCDLFEEEAKKLYLNGAEQRVRHIMKASADKAGKVEKEKAEKADDSEKVLKLPLLPPSTYEEPLQTQLLTGRSKPRVWFGTYNGKQVVVKGPVAKKESKGVLKTQKIKECLGLPHTNAHMDGDYLVFDSLIDYKKLPTRIVTSKIETNVKVPVMTSVGAWEKSMMEKEELVKQLLVGLLFRKVVGTNDTCARNFMVVENVVYSIDDAALDLTTSHMWKMKASMKASVEYVKAMNTHWDYLVNIIEDWETKLSEYPSCMERLALMKDMKNWVW